MGNPEKELVDILKETGVDFTASLPCERIRALLIMVEKTFCHLPLTREEEGVGICAGASLSGRRPAMFVQSSGIGNMINALLSLTGFYELPLALFVSQRGIYKEEITAQVPMGQRLPEILHGAGIRYSIIRTREDFAVVMKELPSVYRRNRIHAFLLSPALWENSACTAEDRECRIRGRETVILHSSGFKHHAVSPQFTRYDILKFIAPFLEGKVVVCNLGFASKELFSIRHRPSNFYMRGSMGMATPIGLGIALTSPKEVVVIEGDGSLLMNLGILATVAFAAPQNLTIMAIDNSAYGSTGNQPTLTGSCVDLELVAMGLGIRNTVKVVTEEECQEIFAHPQKGLRFVHALTIPGNRNVPNVTIHHLENKRLVQVILKG